MPTLNRNVNLGRKARDDNPELYNQLSDMYQDISGVVNTKTSVRVISGQSAPASNQVNRNYNIGDFWVRTDTNTAWIMTSRTTDVDVVWTQIT